MRNEFFLLEHKIRVDVCGQDYWVVNGQGNVSSNEDEAYTHFTLMAANRIVDEFLPYQPVDIICTNEED